MTELQATVEFLVELDKFINVDLFQRGFYQIRLSLRTAPEVVSKVEVTLLNQRQVTSFPLPSFILRDSEACSKTFQILYRNEEVLLSDVALFRAHVLVDSDRLDASLSRAGFYLCVDLWFCEHEHLLQLPQGKNGNSSVPPSPQLSEKTSAHPPPPPPPDFSASNSPSSSSTLDDPEGGSRCGLELISHRSVVLNLKPKVGLHHHLPVLFDYFHLCAIELTVHASLVALHQPYITVPKFVKSNGSWLGNGPNNAGSRPNLNSNEINNYVERRLPDSTLETVLFGNPGSTGNTLSPDGEFQGCLTSNTSPNNAPSRLKRARKVHYDMCHILLSAYDALQLTLEQAQELTGYDNSANSTCKVDADDATSPSSTWLKDVTGGWGVNGPIPPITKSNCERKLELLVANVLSVIHEDDMLHITNTNITQLSAELVVLWGHIIDIVTNSKEIKYDLCRTHHIQRVQRFAEGFFLQKHQKTELITIDDVGLANNLVMAQQVRNSLYMTNLPPLPCECTELDGEPTTLPIVFEDLYVDTSASSTGVSNSGIPTSSSHGVIQPKSSQSCSDVVGLGGSSLQLLETIGNNVKHSPDSVRRTRHMSSTSTASGASADSASVSNRSGNNLIKHRKYMGGATMKCNDKTKDSPGPVVLVGYKQKTQTSEGSRELAVGTLCTDSGGRTSSSGISSSSCDLDIVEEENEIEKRGGRPRSMHCSDSMPYLSHLSQVSSTPTSGCHLTPNSSPTSGGGMTLPASTMPDSLHHVQGTLSGSLPDLANQEVIVDFPPQMTKSQQLMDQFKSDPSLLDETRSGEVGESEEEEKVSVYDVLVESMQETNLDEDNGRLAGHNPFTNAHQKYLQSINGDCQLHLSCGTEGFKNMR